MAFVIGLACGTDAWRPQLRDLLHSKGKEACRYRLHLCFVDNRGIGNSSAPTEPELYSTAIMAKDVIAVMDDLRWPKAHIVGFSMGAMIATKLAAIAPDRVETLTLLSVTAGGFASIPSSWRGLRYLFKAAMAKTPEDRTKMDLKLHYTKRTLKHVLGNGTRWEFLYNDYLRSSKTAHQTQQGLRGQLHAVWHHKVTREDVNIIVSRNFPVMYIHGREDLLANYRSAARLAERMRACLVLLDGAHFIPRECGHEVNLLLESTILNYNPNAHRSRHIDPANQSMIQFALEIKMDGA